MFRKFILGLILSLSATLAFGNDSALKTYNSELVDALEFLSKLPEEERPFVLFLTSFTVPQTVKIKIRSPANPQQQEDITLRDAMKPLIDFTIHSLSGGTIYRRCVQLTDTLFYVDIRDYEWTQEAIEKVSFEDPYFKEPWVDRDSYTAMRVEAGNNILRADWFIANTMDVIKQVDTDRKVLLYYELLYAKAGVPKNVKEFQDKWLVDVQKSIKNKTAKGTIVDYGESIVARHNRQLFRIRTDTGYYWETQDVKNQEGNRDFIENIVTFLHGKDDFDAGEFITTNFIGMQVYLLANNKGDRIEFADNVVATDHTQQMDKRVATPRSCIACHAVGINPAANALKALLNTGVELNYATKQDAIDSTAFFLDDLDSLILDDQNIYKKATLKACGLDVGDITGLFVRFMEWYEQPLDLAQVSLETGKMVDECRQKISITARGRLGGLVQGRKIPRESWAEPNRGAFSEAMLLLYGLGEQNKLLQDNYTNIENKHSQPINTVVYNIMSPAPMWNGRRPVLDKNGDQLVVPVGTVISPLRITDGWIQIVFNNQRGYVSSALVKKVE